MQGSEDLLPKFLRDDRPEVHIRWPIGMDPVFEEVQKLDSTWLWILGFDLIFVCTILLVTESPWWIFLVIGLISFAVMLFLKKLELKFRINREGFYLLFNIWYSKDERKIPWTSIASVRVRKFTGFTEQSGYGKKRYKHKTYYNLNGNKAIEIQLRDGSQIVIGTRRSKEIVELISRLS